MKHNNSKSGFGGLEYIVCTFITCVAVLIICVVGNNISAQFNPKYGCRPQVISMIEAAYHGDTKISFTSVNGVTVCTLSPDGLKQSTNVIEIAMNSWEVRYQTHYLQEQEILIAASKIKKVDEYFKSKPKQVEQE